MMDRFLGDAFGVMSCPFWQYCSAVWCSAAHSYLKLQDGAVSGASFLTGGVFECDIAHRPCVTALCMLYKIICNPTHPLNCALPGPNVPLRVTRGALTAIRYTYAPPRCRTSQYGGTFIPLSVSLWNDLDSHVLDGVGLTGFKRRVNVLSCQLLLSYTFFPFLFFLSKC